MPSTETAFFSSGMLVNGTGQGKATLSLLPDGRIAAAWEAGNDNDDAAAEIRFSILERGEWRPPQVIASRESTAAGTFTHAGHLGAPLLHTEGGWLHLWYASRDGLAGASLNHSRSTNGGQHWSKPEKLSISPLAVGSLHPGAPLLALEDGGLGLPLSRSALGAHGEWLRLSATGRIVDKQRLPGLQPQLLVFDAQHALALLRDTAPGRIGVALTDNGGQTWQAATPLPLANLNSPFAALRLRSGRLLLAGNPETGRTSLRLWISADAGKTWQAGRSIEQADDSAADFSAPALLLGRDGRIHLAYDWRRQGVRHVTFNEAWLDEAP